MEKLWRGLRENLEGMQAMHQAVVNVLEAKTPAGRLDAYISVMVSRLASLKEITGGPDRPRRTRVLSDWPALRRLS
jgi:hypothetical protein